MGRFKSTGLYDHVPKLPGVYMITDIVSGLRYIGSSKNLKRRYRNYFNGSLSDFGKKLFLEGGILPENITFVPIVVFDKVSKFDLMIVERYFIHTYSTCNPGGLNTGLCKSGLSDMEKIRKMASIILKTGSIY